MMAEAAGAYEAGESWAAAGGVYIRAGLKDKAAAAYEKAGEAETAAKLYQEIGNVAKAGDLYARAGDTFRSGEAAARAGEREKAIGLLQRVIPSDENYRAATELLARLFIETGRPALAIERTKKAIGAEPISAANLDFHYWLALAHEASGGRAEALELFKKIQAEDLQFRDVQNRVARLSAALAAGATPPPRGAPPQPTRAPQPAAAGGASSAAPAPAPAPARGPRFVPKEEVAKGPLGAVFRGEDATDGRSVAMRMLSPELLKAPGLVSAVAAELKAASQLSHPNLVKVIALMEWEGARCVVTEYVAGRTFAEAIANGRKLAFQQVHSLGRVIAQVLALVHEKGLVHGSIRPSNVMVAAGVIKLADLGLGKLARAAGLRPAYDAPEGGPSAADDLFALSAVMYHLLTGTHPLTQPQGAGLPLPSTLTPGVPEAMDKLLLRGLHPRPELRLASAIDLQRELREMVKIG
jgi:serine/threonine-protein kinase